MIDDAGHFLPEEAPARSRTRSARCEADHLERQPARVRARGAGRGARLTRARRGRAAGGDHGLVAAVAGGLQTIGLPHAAFARGRRPRREPITRRRTGVVTRPAAARARLVARGAVARDHAGGVPRSGHGPRRTCRTPPTAGSNRTRSPPSAPASRPAPARESCAATSTRPPRVTGRDRDRSRATPAGACARAGERWDSAELGVVPGLREVGFTDAFRAVHGYASKEPSWVWRHGGGWRLDHIFVSGLRVVAALVPPCVAGRRSERPLGAGGRRGVLGEASGRRGLRLGQPLAPRRASSTACPTGPPPRSRSAGRSSRPVGQADAGRLEQRPRARVVEHDVHVEYSR